MINEKIFYPDEQLQQSLQSEVEQDENIDEESLPSYDQFFQTQVQRKKMVPQGTSDYQATWIFDDDNSTENVSPTFQYRFHLLLIFRRTKNNRLKSMIDNKRHNFKAINPMKLTSKSIQTDRFLLEFDFKSLSSLSLSRQANLSRFRYRGLKSFSTTKWDSKQNLPPDYRRIYQFHNFRSMIKKIQLEQENNERRQDSAQVLFQIGSTLLGQRDEFCKDNFSIERSAQRLVFMREYRSYFHRN